MSVRCRRSAENTFCPPSSSRRAWSFARALAMLGAAYAVTNSYADDWPTWRGVKGDGVWRETGVVSQFKEARSKPVWSAPISSGYTGPTVADGRVYVMDRVVPSETTGTKQVERVHCFDAKDGKPIWTHTYDAEYRGVGYEAGPRACVVIADGRAYTLGTMGHIFCLDAKTGKVLWAKDAVKEFNVEMPMWGLATTPIVFEDLVIYQVGGTPAADLIAFDRRSGEERWRALEDGPSYSTPTMIEQGGSPVMVVWTQQNLCGVDPRSGGVFWQVPYEPGKIRMNVASPVHHKNWLFVSSFFDGAMLVDAAMDEPTAKMVWRRRGESEKKSDAIHSTISTPVVQGDFIYGTDSYGELRGLKRENGDRVWEDLKVMPKERWGTMHFVRHEPPDRKEPVVRSEPAPRDLAASQATTRPGTSTVRDVWVFTETGDLVIGELTENGFLEHSRTHIIDPTTDQLRRGDGVCWSHPAFANKCVYQRSDKELVCVSLAE